MNRIVEIVNVDVNPNDPIIRQVANAQVQPIGEENSPTLNLHLVKRGQNADNLVQRIRQNNVGRIIILLRQSNKFLTILASMLAMLLNHSSCWPFMTTSNRPNYLEGGKFLNP